MPKTTLIKIAAFAIASFATCNADKTMNHSDNDQVGPVLPFGNTSVELASYLSAEAYMAAHPSGHKATPNPGATYGVWKVPKWNNGWFDYSKSDIICTPNLVWFQGNYERQDRAFVCIRQRPCVALSDGGAGTPGGSNPFPGQGKGDEPHIKTPLNFAGLTPHNNNLEPGADPEISDDGVAGWAWGNQAAIGEIPHEFMYYKGMSLTPEIKDINEWVSNGWSPFNPGPPEFDGADISPWESYGSESVIVGQAAKPELQDQFSGQTVYWEIDAWARFYTCKDGKTPATCILEFDKLCGDRFVVVAGSDDKTDWAQDIDNFDSTMPDGQIVKKGFFTEFNQFKGIVESGLAQGNKYVSGSLADNTLKINNPITYFVGHSLGGATATLLAGHAKWWFGSNITPRAITFGMPPVFRGNTLTSNYNYESARISSVHCQGFPKPNDLQKDFAPYVQHGPNKHQNEFSGHTLQYFKWIYRHGETIGGQVSIHDDINWQSFTSQCDDNTQPDLKLYPHKMYNYNDNIVYIATMTTPFSNLGTLFW